MELAETKYITTDLDLYAKFDLKAFSDKLAALGMCDLQTGFHAEASYWGFRQAVHFATFEILARRRYNVESEIVAMLDILESLPAETRREWNRCIRRRFNVGYNAGIDPFTFHNRISSKTLARMAALKIDHEVTIYRFDPDGRTPQVFVTTES